MLADHDRSDHLSVLKKLIQHDVNLNARDVIGNTAIWMATGFGNSPKTLLLAGVLVDAEAEVNIHNRFGSGVLHEPVMLGNYEAIQLLLDAGADPELIHEYDEQLTAKQMARNRPAIDRMFVINENTRKRKCANCGMGANVNETLKKCGNCKSVLYCGDTCQLEHWKAPNGHKSQCKKTRMITVQLSSPPEGTVIMSVAGEQSKSTARPPDYSELIEVKIQYTSSSTDMLVYDKEHSFGNKAIKADAVGFKEIEKLIRSDGVVGRKAYLEAFYLPGVDRLEVKLKTRRPKDW
jgi:hypothetical protein